MKFAVIGAKGKMGALHSTVLEELGHEVLRYDVVDGPISYDMIPRVDGAVIATPTHLHLETSVPFIVRSIPVLIEKPLEATLPKALALLAVNGITLPSAVGYLGRFNAAYRKLEPYLHEPGWLNIERQSPDPGPNYGGVDIDIASHDIDLLYFTFGEELSLRIAHKSDKLAVYHFTAGEISGAITAHYSVPHSKAKPRIWHWQGQTHTAIIDMTYQRMWLDDDRAPAIEPVNQLTEQAKAWIDLINGRESEICTMGEGLTVLALTVNGGQA